METLPSSSPPAVNVSAIANVRTWSAFIHASALLGIFLNFPGHLLPPLILWLIKPTTPPNSTRTARKRSTSRSQC